MPVVKLSIQVEAGKQNGQFMSKNARKKAQKAQVQVAQARQAATVRAID